MILFNFKNWSGIKIALGVSIVFNAFLLIVMFTGMQTQIMAQNDLEQLQYKYDQMENLHKKTEIFVKCVSEINLYRVNTNNLKDDVVPFSSFKNCSDSWSSK